jgi:Uma2 family endonuclease
MAENTLQFQWIVTIEGGLDALLLDDPNVFVAGDLLWYPVEGDNKTRQAPDAMVAFGRPKGHRGSYLQWREGGIAPQVAFEVLSPGNRRREMEEKRGFYARYGVEEYYEYDPDRGTLSGWLNSGGEFVPIESMEDWVSPRLGVRFGLDGNALVLTGPNGERFKSYVEVVAEREQARNDAEQAWNDAEQARNDAEQALRQAAQARTEAERERLARETAEARAERLAARLRESGLSEE